MTQVRRSPPPAPSPTLGRGQRTWPPVLWGVVLLGGGLAIWHSIAGWTSVPEAWRATSGVEGPTTDMVSIVRAGGSQQGDLLRLEWPAHPKASAYHVRFRGPSGRVPTPVPVQGTIFLYDLRSNVLQLPREFDWEVTAVLADGSEVVTPSQHVSLGG